MFQNILVNTSVLKPSDITLIYILCHLFSAGFSFSKNYVTYDSQDCVVFPNCKTWHNFEISTTKCDYITLDIYLL